jgi:hypothetical protein
MSDVPAKTGNRFVKGQSGNPRGRPKGSKNKTTLLREAMQTKADRMLSKEVPEVLKVVLQAAKKGDMSAAKMILDRAVPVKKADDGNDKTGNGGVTITIKNLTGPGSSETVIDGEVIED